MSIPSDVDALGRALGRRVDDVAAALRRLDGLESGTAGVDASRPTSGDVQELVLRTLRLAGELDNHRILRSVADGTTVMSGLTALTGRPRLALWEAVGDLVQVGLLERDPGRDAVALTPAGRALLGLVDQLVAVGERP